MSRRDLDGPPLATPSPTHLPKGERRRRVLELLARGAIRAAERSAQAATELIHPPDDSGSSEPSHRLNNRPKDTPNE